MGPRRTSTRTLPTNADSCKGRVGGETVSVISSTEESQELDALLELSVILWKSRMGCDCCVWFRVRIIVLMKSRNFYSRGNREQRRSRSELLIGISWAVR